MDTFYLCPACIGKTIAMLLVANGAPIIAKNLLKNRFDRPLDMGQSLADDRPLFGYSKTWRCVRC